MLNAAIGLLALVSLFSYVNTKFLRFQSTIGMLSLSLACGLLFSIVSSFSSTESISFVELYTQDMLGSDAFRDLILNFLLGFLLFAATLSIDIGHLQHAGRSIAWLATIGVFITTFLIGTMTYYMLIWTDNQLSFIHCLLFGSIMAPTDPIAVVAILRKMTIDPSIVHIIEGESLFNDGIGIVVFITLSGIMATKGGGDADHSPFLLALEIFSLEAIGGIIFGSILGFFAFYLIRGVQDDSQSMILLSLAIVGGGYTLSSLFHLSGALAMVVCGLIVGNMLRKRKFNPRTRMSMFMTWSGLDEILNAFLFSLVGLAILYISFEGKVLFESMLVIPIVIIARFISIVINYAFFIRQKILPSLLKQTIMFTWGGLRGGLSIAMALSIQEPVGKDTLISMSFFVVIFSILVQGTTFKKVAEYAIK